MSFAEEQKPFSSIANIADDHEKKIVIEYEIDRGPQCLGYCPKHLTMIVFVSIVCVVFIVGILVVVSTGNEGGILDHIQGISRPAFINCSIFTTEETDENQILLDIFPELNNVTLNETIVIPSYSGVAKDILRFFKNDLIDVSTDNNKNQRRLLQTTTNETIQTNYITYEVCLWEYPDGNPYTINNTIDFGQNTSTYIEFEFDEYIGYPSFTTLVRDLPDLLVTTTISSKKTSLRDFIVTDSEIIQHSESILNITSNETTWQYWDEYMIQVLLNVNETESNEILTILTNSTSTSHEELSQFMIGLELTSSILPN